MARLNKVKILELVITTVVAGLIVVTTMYWFSDFKKANRDEQRIADIEQIQKDLVSYFSEHRTYPETSDLYNVISNIPSDPVGAKYSYEKMDTDSYVLGVCLEDTRSADIQSYSKADAGNYTMGSGASQCTCASINAYCVNQDL